MEVTKPLEEEIARFGPAYPRPVIFSKVFTFESKQQYLLFKDDPLILAMMSILELHVLARHTTNLKMKLAT
jgi:hypothetical protein